MNIESVMGDSSEISEQFRNGLEEHTMREGQRAGVGSPVGNLNNLLGVKMKLNKPSKPL